MSKMALDTLPSQFKMAPTSEAHQKSVSQSVEHNDQHKSVQNQVRATLMNAGRCQLYWHVLLFDEAETWTPSSLMLVLLASAHTVGRRHLLPYLQSIMSDNKEQQFSIQPHPAKDNGELDDAALTTLAFMHNVDKLRRAERVY